MKKPKKYWKGLEELNKDSDFEKDKHKEFPNFLPFEKGILEENGVSRDRRDFLKMFGFGVAAVSLASCEMPVQKAIPYLNKPEEITPGVANWYASSYSEGGDYCSILVKTREGRPIKIEGNELSNITRGGVSSRVHASILGLYDIDRLKNPLKAGAESSWEEVDEEIIAKLSAIKEKEGNIIILTSTIISPSTKRVISDFIENYPTAKHITYDPVSYSGIINANEKCFEKPIVPSYNFDKANVILSFGADFLGTWLSPIEFTKQYVKNRRPENGSMSRHIQFETNLTITGAKADVRVPIKPSQIGIAVLNLYNHIAKSTGAAAVSVDKFELAGNLIENTAKELLKNKGKSLVISGSNDAAIQEVINSINELLGNYTSTIDLNNPSNQKQGNDGVVATLVKSMNNGDVDGLLMYNVNPVYNYTRPDEFKEGLKKVGLKISFCGKNDETASFADYNCPEDHYLESWNDAEPKKGYFSICQPTIRTLFNTRPAQESLLKWSGNNQKYYDYIRKYWRENLFTQQNKYLSFKTFWNKCIHDGVFELNHEPSQSNEFKGDVESASNSIKGNYSISNSTLELVLYEKVAIGNGNEANNPWLQEVPDPISKATWDNYVGISPRLAKELDLKQEDVVSVSAEGVSSIELPILVQPGQAYKTVAIALGYGRTKAGRTADGVGKNAYPFATVIDGNVQCFNKNVQLSKLDGTYPLAQTQTHHTYLGRPIIKETTLEEYKNDSKAGNLDREVVKKNLVTLYDKFEPKGHHWAMVIDLNACTGCNACVVSCGAENNVPVVGKNEVKLRREMHWLRIDRYYSSSADDDHVPEEDNPEVTFQPMLCQHCDNAPCENVCPVAATNHSSEGINQMAYNRCIGTRYCANNCPYKVRRFNWFDYAATDGFPYNEKDLWPGEKDDWGMLEDLPRMALNPDVIVRGRGVMEKCSFCIQRIQAGKLDAKKEQRNIKDGEVKSACQQSCPANAIVFGDLLDPESEVSKLYKNDRMYHVLEELHVLPSVGYLTKVKNKNKDDNKDV
ncbi:TAT-variant-translocated molybdopterin oxidoreductase [Bacteroidales bacterium AH-315-N07]|nr:TAT-variant-translocated molybdopterin oxidoreductase [Bacteroidales bacterium AH-315-N07]